MYVNPLREMDPPIIPRDRLEQFIQEVFHNYAELHTYHRRMLDKLHEIQRDEHPVIRSITAAIYDAVLNFREAYMEYIPNYPIAAYRIDDEMANNPQFKSFVDVSWFCSDLLLQSSDPVSPSNARVTSAICQVLSGCLGSKHQC